MCKFATTSLLIVAAIGAAASRGQAMERESREIQIVAEAMRSKECAQEITNQLSAAPHVKAVSCDMNEKPLLSRWQMGAGQNLIGFGVRSSKGEGGQQN